MRPGRQMKGQVLDAGCKSVLNRAVSHVEQWNLERGAYRARLSTRLVLSSVSRPGLVDSKVQQRLEAFDAIRLVARAVDLWGSTSASASCKSSREIGPRHSAIQYLSTGRNADTRDVQAVLQAFGFISVGVSLRKSVVYPRFWQQLLRHPELTSDLLTGTGAMRSIGLQPG